MHNYENVRDHMASIINGDWAPAFSAAITAAVANGKPGVFVPGNSSPYTVRRPGAQMPSIDLRGRTDFVLRGEGPMSKIQMLGSGGGGSWSMILVSGDSEDIRIEDLFLDGNRANLTNLDPGQHTHTLHIGGGSTGGTARRIVVRGCIFANTDGDGIALIARSGAYGAGADITSVTIDNCQFIDCFRSGISNQRAAQLVRITNCHFQGTADQDIDFEPSGTPGPRRYIIMNNHFIHSTGAASVTLSGCSGGDPSDQNIFAFNHVVGGRVGMVHTRNLLFHGNYITGDLATAAPVLNLEGTADGVRISNNHIVRPPGAKPGKVLAFSSNDSGTTVSKVRPADDTIQVANHGLLTGDGPIQVSTTGTLPGGLALSTDYWVVRDTQHLLKLCTSFANATANVPTAIDITSTGTGSHTITKLINFPRGVDVSGNRLHTHVASDGDNCTVLAMNGVACSFDDNEVANLSSGVITSGVRFITNAAMTTRVTDWVISNNRITGNGDRAGTGLYTYGATVSPVGVAVAGIDISHNRFRGCTNQIRYNRGSGGSYADIPLAVGNAGEGTDFADLSNVGAVQVGGNATSQAMFSGNGNPTFAARKASIYQRRDGSIGNLLYVNVDNSTTWIAYA